MLAWSGRLSNRNNPMSHSHTLYLAFFNLSLKFMILVRYYTHSRHSSDKAGQVYIGSHLSRTPSLNSHSMSESLSRAGSCLLLFCPFVPVPDCTVFSFYCHRPLKPGPHSPRIDEIGEDWGIWGLGGLLHRDPTFCHSDYDHLLHVCQTQLWGSDPECGNNSRPICILHCHNNCLTGEPSIFTDHPHHHA